MTREISYPPELLDGKEDSLADLVVMGLPISPVWEYQAPGPIDRPPLYYAGHVVIKGSKTFRSVNSNSGTEEWRYEAVRKPSVVDILDNTVIFQMPPFPSPLHAVALETGQDRWQTPSPVRVFSSDHGSRLFIALANRDSLATEYQALDAGSGRVIWVSEVHPQGRGAGVLYDQYFDEVYVRDITDRRVVLDGQTGKLCRELSDEGSMGSAMLVDAGVLYSEEFLPDQILAIDGRKSTILWKRTYPHPTTSFGPILYEGLLFTRTPQEALLALNRNTGDVQWQYPSSSNSVTSVRLLSNFVVLDDIVYGIFSDARLRGFDLATGQELGYIQFVDVSDVAYDITVPGLASSDQMLFVSLGKTKLYAFRTAH
jgi:outer membrane protein assembly factor BamB